MNTFKMQCVNYLLMRGWSDESDCWSVMHNYPGSNFQRVCAGSIGEAMDIQLGWDDEGAN